MNNILCHSSAFLSPLQRSAAAPPFPEAPPNALRYDQGSATSCVLPLPPQSYVWMVAPYVLSIVQFCKRDTVPGYRGYPATITARYPVAISAIRLILIVSVSLIAAGYPCILVLHPFISVISDNSWISRYCTPSSVLSSYQEQLDTPCIPVLYPF